MKNRELIWSTSILKHIILIIISLFVGKNLHAQVVSGKVTDAQSQESLPGVNVVVKGTTIGTSTNNEGNYQLTVSSLQDTLIFSFVGYQTREVPINGRTEIDVALQSQAIASEELVVVGYGEQRSADISGSVEQVSSEQFEKQPITRVDQALEGKVAGVNISQTNGRPGSGYKLRIRGANSIQGNNRPLYVVDGLQVNNIDNLDAKDIASIEVLKDASATAMYGSRGANGVVLVTTKSGSTQGGTIIAFNSSVGFQSVMKELDLLSGAQFAETVNAAREANDNPAAFTDQEISELQANGGTDWQDLIFRSNAPILNNKLSLSGGDEKFNYYISGGYLDQEGIVYRQNYKRYSIRSNFNYRYSEKLDFKLNVYGSREDRDHASARVFNSVLMDPTMPNKDSEGNYNLTSSFANIRTNPYAGAAETERERFNSIISSTAEATYNFRDDLSLKISGGLRYRDRNTNAYTPSVINQRGTATINNNRRIRFQNTNQLTYDKDFNSNNSLKVDLIFEQQFIRNDNNRLNGGDFPTDATGYKDIGLAQTQNINSGFNTQKLISYIGRVNYVWQDKYIVTATARADGSSKFREGNRYGFFPSGSIGWRLSEEQFIQKLDFFDNLKLRASYGLTGSQAIGPLATRDRLVTGNGVGYPINNGNEFQIGIAPSNRLANPDLKWETTKQANIGLDMSFLNSRLSLTADIYRKITEDLLVNEQLPDYTGVNVITRNLGKIENKGFELGVGLTPIQNDQLNWTTNFNISVNKNKVKELGGRNEIFAARVFLGGSTAGIPPSFVRVGKPLGLFQGYVFEGIYQEGEEDEAAQYGKQPGDSNYQDVNDDGVINDDDITAIGNPEPDVTFGFNSTLNYKNVDLNVVFKGQYGGKIYNLARGQMFGVGGGVRDPVTAEVLNRWTPENPSNTVPAFSPTKGDHLLSTRFVEDGTYLKIANIALGYNLPAEFVEKLTLGSLRIYVSGENLITLTGYNGFDPELSAGGEDDLSQSIDTSPYPTAKTITLGLDVTF